MRLYITTLVIAILIIGCILYELIAWKECLVTSPWWYCLRILG